MPKAGELDWSEQLNKSSDYVHTPTTLWAANNSGGKQGGVDPLNKARKINEDGEIPRKPSNEEISEYILKGMDQPNLGQWKDSEHLHKEIVSQAQADELQKNWENTVQNFYEAAYAPVNKYSQEEDWGTGKSFNDSLTKEERLKRNMFTGE
jgi:hypothetical protein